MTTTPDKSRDSIETAKASVQSLGDEAVSTAKDLKDKAIEEATHRAEAGKAGVADEISGLGNALRRASEELRAGSPQERTFGQMAGALADVSDRVREKDLGEIAGDLSDFARRNPLAFLGGAALLGFAGTRFARATQRNAKSSGESVDLGNPWDTGDDDKALDAAIRGHASATSTSGPIGTGESS